MMENTPGTAGGPGGRDRTLAVAKNRAKMTFFSGGKKNYPKKIFFFCIYLLVMPKYWVKNYFAHGRFPEVGQKQKTEKKRERERERKRERLNNDKNNGQLRIPNATSCGARKAAWAKMLPELGFGQAAATKRCHRQGCKNALIFLTPGTAIFNLPNNIFKISIK